MKSQRRTTSILAVFAAALAVAPAVASADPLLSGYGGPGQGNQAILGSALLNTPRGGGGAGGGPSGTGGPSASTESRAGNQDESAGSAQGSPARGGAGGSSSAGGQPGGRGARKRFTGRARSGKGAAGGSQSAAGDSQDRLAQASEDASRAYTVSERGAAAHPSGALGLSSQDILYILLALAALAVTTMLTGRVARTDSVTRAG